MNYPNTERARETRTLNRFLAVCILIAATLALLTVGNFRAEAHEPYGGCDEAWQAPRSDGARHCREHGWTVRSRVVIDPLAQVRFNRLPACAYEDSIGCHWDAARMGNGRGDSFVALRTRHGYRVVYVR